MAKFFDELKNFDSEVFAACDRELSRQKHNIELIASENIVSEAVLLAAGGVLTNKYAEGYPGKRSTLTKLKKSQEKELKSSSALTTLTFSLTAVLTLTLLYSSHSFSPATPLWV